MKLQVVKFVEVKNSPCIGNALLKYGVLFINLKIMCRKGCGVSVEFPQIRQTESYVSSCWIKNKKNREEFQLIVIRQLTEKYPDARRVIDSKLKKVVQ